ncbi:MAG: MFS transporter [Candidatus Aenigmarchaeota archaeon]|nr:MFS transporter [Candidatus Aenigmarchaeota archaeon]
MSRKLYMKKQRYEDSNIPESRNIMVEAIFSETSHSIKSRFLTPLAVFLNASASQIGALSAFSSLAAICGQIPGSYAVSRISGKKIWIISNIFARSVAMFVLALIALYQWESSITILVLMGAMISFFVAFREPSVSSSLADMVPKNSRGPFFGRRDSIISLISVFIVLTAGLALKMFGFPVIFIAGGIAGLLSIPPILRMRIKDGERSYSFRKLIRISPSDSITSLKVNKQLVYFTLYIALVRFGIGIGDPFFEVYMLRDIGLDYIAYTAAIVTGIIFDYIFLRYWGKASSHFGSKNILIVTGTLMCFTPLFYSMSTSFAHIILTKVYVGFTFSGFTLMTFSYLLDIAPQRQRYKYIARFNVFKEGGFFLGTSAGTLLALTFVSTGDPFTSGLKMIFYASAFFRFASIPILLSLKKKGQRGDNYRLGYVMWETAGATPVRIAGRKISHLINISFAPLKLASKIIEIAKRLFYYHARGRSWCFG